jgi:60 kDa SS-A/Ro ribonucleoprotein
MSYLKKHIDATMTPPTRPLRGKHQISNDSGGYVFKTNKWNTLNRFLITGAEGGTYYVSESHTVNRSLDNLEKCLNEDGVKTVNQIVEISFRGRAPKNDQAILALAAASIHKDVAVRRAAFDAVPKVCRTGTHLYQFAEFRKCLGGGWGTSMKNTVGAWFSRDINKVSLQVAKYKQRNGWSARDMLRLSHPQPPTPAHQAVFKWVCSGEIQENLPDFLMACHEIETADENKACKLILQHKLPREVVPTRLLNSKNIWQALLDNMPITAMIRNLGKMTSMCLVSNGSEATRNICQRLSNAEALRNARIHPINMLSAMRVYSSGHGDKGKLSWKPVTNIISAMDDAFYECFKNVEPIGKPTVIALDVSSSMTWNPIRGMQLTPREISAAMAMVTLRTEKHDCTIVGFARDIVGIPILRTDSLPTVIKKIEQLDMGATNIAAPLLWALNNKIESSGFIMYTDNQINIGSMHPSEALKLYRKKMNPDARLVVAATEASSFSIADSNDSGSLDIAGFDTATPNIISEFIKGNI